MEKDRERHSKMLLGLNLWEVSLLLQEADLLS